MIAVLVFASLALGLFFGTVFGQFLFGRTLTRRERELRELRQELHHVLARYEVQTRLYQQLLIDRGVAEAKAAEQVTKLQELVQSLRKQLARSERMLEHRRRQPEDREPS